ncbi:LysR family transcriptional regulator ArgP [Pseudogemmobacter humi]|uniref:Putative HTH-type transcriptional regulator/MT2039 n=1 Tax=Pseudogemmobacter humi TaxID=2483812 RepID=A0A3P5XYF8_9RHOB|nr:LysR family transcriptional regulator ArgP [Pseudogemmobacter humi]VDC33180.1 putative HTH-type transcriptional regulator/MT2039 [Pseudogemmobacter humi]
MLDPAQLAALAAVHRRGAFDLAAAELAVTPSAVSQRIRALEERIGTLLIRRGQPCAATEAGLRLIRHFDEIALLESRLGEDLPALSAGPASLRIAVNADSLATWVLPALAACEDFLYDLVIDDQDVSQDWLRRGEVMAAITGHPGPLQGCDTVALGALRYRATASPDYLATWFPEGVTPGALARAPTLVFSGIDRLQHLWAARETGGALPAAGLPCHRLASSQGFVEACVLGLGWAMNPEALAAPHLASGALVEIRPESPLDVALYWQFPRLMGPALAPLTKAIRAQAARALIPPECRGGR